MADENANNSTEKTTSIDKPKITINPITGLPFGGGTINPETNQLDVNPITGQRYGLGLLNSEGKANYGGYSPDFPTLGGKGFSPSNIFTDTYTVYNQEPMENYKKYGVPMGRHFDWDELRARNQSAGETIMRGVGKSLVTFGGALLENTIGFFAGLGEMATGGAYYDNAIGKTVDKWNNWAEEAMPIYITEEEQNMNTWQKMGTAHFWADDVLGGMSYTAAAAASIYLTGGGGLLTKGTGAVATLAFGKTALWNTTKAVINGTKLSTDLAKGVTLTNRLFSAAQVLEAGAMMSLAESSVEARETQRTTYDNLVQNYLNEHKTSDINSIPKEKLKEFEEVSYNAGNTNFVMQMPVLMGTNLLMFGRSVSGFKVGSSINKDVIWNTATESYVSKLADKGFMSATLSKLKPVAVQGLNEAFQESYQFGSSAFASSYHIDKYNNNGNGDISKALADGWDAMGTQEGIESALIGFITGGFFGGGRALTSKQYSTRVEQADRLAALVNGGTMINAASQYQNANAVSAASERMEMHLQNGNIKGYQDARFELIAAQSMEMLDRGGIEMYIDQLQESSTLSESEFKKLYGYLETDAHGDPISIEKQSNGKNQHEIIDGIVEKVRAFEKTYNDVNDRFPLPQRTTGLPRLLTSKEKLAAEDQVYNERANLRNELIFSAAGVKDRNRRMSNIQNSIQETANDVYMYNRDSRGQTVSMPDILAEQQPSHKGVKTWQEPGLKEEQEAFVGEQVGVDEQGNPIYAPGTDQVVQPNRYDPAVQLIETQFKLKAVEDQIRQSDPLAADKIADLNKDYIELLTDNNFAIKRYNDLSSNGYAQKQWTDALNVAINQKVQENADKEAVKVVQEAKTAKEISDHINEDSNLSPEIQTQAKERFEQLKKDENDAYKKYYGTASAAAATPAERLKVLEEIDKTNLSNSEKEGLRQAIATTKQAIQTEKLKNQSDEVTDEEIEVKETKKEIEEELSPENVGGVESISENGREFQIEGTQYYNREDNPLDAIIKEGDNITIKLQNEQGDTHFIKAPQGRVMALYYAILASEQYKVDSNQGIAKQDIVNRATVIIEENKKELKPTIKDAKKDSSSLRSEMYGLERSLDELLESQDQLRTSLIQDDSATKEDINANPTIKALKKQIKNTKAAITRRRNVLLNRNESVTPTITEITAVEQKSINDVSELTRKIAELENQILTAEETIKRTETLMEQYQNDPGSFQQVSKENADAQDVINNSTEEIKQLYTLIEYKNQKLRRLENEKQNRPTDPTKQTTPEDTGTTEKQITEGENPNTETVPQEERVTIAANLGYERINSNNYIVKVTEAEFLPEENQYEPGQAYFTRIKNAIEVNIPGYSEVEAFTYKDQNGDTLVVDSLTGTVLGKHKNAKMAGKQAVETLDQGITDQSSPTEMFGNIINENAKVSPAYEPINTIEEKENFTNSEKRTQKTIILENGKAEIVENTSPQSPGKRGGMVVMTQAEVEEHDRQVSKDLSEVISDAAQQEIDENKPYGNTQSIRELVDSAVREKKKGYDNKNIDYSNLTYEEGERQLQEIIDLIDKRVRMNQILLNKGKEAYSADKVIEEVMNKHNTSAILKQAQIGQVAALHRYIKRKMSPTQPTTTLGDNFLPVKTEEFTVTMKDGESQIFRATTYLDGSVSWNEMVDGKPVGEASIADSSIMQRDNISPEEAIKAYTEIKVRDIKTGKLESSGMTYTVGKVGDYTTIMNPKRWAKLTQEQKERIDPERAKGTTQPTTAAPVTPGSLQKKMTEKLPEIANPTAKKHVPKELVKTRIATQYIGDGSPNSSTDRYRKMYAEEGVANTGNYTVSDIVYVSSNGKRGGRVNPVKDGVLQGEYQNVQKAMDANATIIMDTADHLKRTKNYNIGEIALAEYLTENGYKREGNTGIWKSIEPITEVAPVAPIEQQIKKSEYEVHVTGDMLSGWDMSTTPFNVPGVKIKDLRFPKKGSEQEKSRDSKGRTYDVSVQNGKKVFTIVDHSIKRGSRQGGISASMVFNENTTNTLEDVKGGLTAIMDGLLGVRGKGNSSFTSTNINFDWKKLDVKEIATPSVIMEESTPEGISDPIVKTEMKPVVTKNARSNPETFKPWFIDTVSDSQDSKNTYKEQAKLVEIGKNLDSGNTTWVFGDLRAEVDGRPMVSVDIVETGESFIMYKSTGTGTGVESKGEWVPIPGFAKNGWFVKDMWNGANPKFSKYHIKTFQEIADALVIHEALPEMGGITIPGQSSTETKLKKTFESNFSVNLGNDTKTSKVRGDDTTGYNIPVNDRGLPISWNPDMLNKEAIEIDKSVLLDPTVYDKQVEFELIPNDWYTATYPEGNWQEAPIYVKIDGKYIGKLQADKSKKGTSEERKLLVEKLQAGEKVTTKINEIYTQNFNWAKTEDHQSWFYNPNEVMERGQVILAFTHIETDNNIFRPFWITSEVADSKNQGDLAAIQNDLFNRTREGEQINYGQVAVVIRPKNNPAGKAEISVGSTQFLTPTAQKVAIEALETKDHNRARQIIANNYMREASDSPTFLEFYRMKDELQMMVYRSPALNKLVRINEHELAKALGKSSAKFGLVQTYDPGTGKLEYEALPQDQIDNTDWDLNIKEDFENFLKGDQKDKKGKKYHIDRALGNTVAPYKSPVHPGNKYNSYQEYLFAEQEIGGERVVGFGHNSIFATDLVNLNGSFFNNPRVEFGKGDLKGKTVQDIANPVKQERPMRTSEEEELKRIARDMGLEEDDIPDCS